MSSTMRSSYMDFSKSRPPMPCIPKQNANPIGLAAVDKITSTQRESYRDHHRNVAPSPFRPATSSEPPWSRAIGAHSLPRSTSQDSFQSIPMIRQLSADQFKPPRKWQPVDFVAPLSTTASAAFVQHPHVQRAPIRPTRAPSWFGEVEARFSLTPPSTIRTAYKGVAGRPATAIIPQSSGRVYGSDDVEAIYETTQRSAYRPTYGAVKPYVAAIKPDDNVRHL
jgi:hypothetical protein